MSDSPRKTVLSWNGISFYLQKSMLVGIDKLTSKYLQPVAD